MMIMVLCAEIEIEFNHLTTEYRFRMCRLYNEFIKVLVSLQHGDKSQAGQKKAKQIGHAVIVIYRAWENSN